MTQRRHWRNNTESEHLADFADVWLEVYDEDELYTSERLEILSLISKLENQIGYGYLRGIVNDFQCLKSSASEVESTVLDDVLEPIQDFSLGSEAFESRKDVVMGKLERFAEEASEIRTIFEENDINADPHSFYQRLDSAVEDTAEEDAESELKKDEIEKLAMELRDKLTSTSVKTEYRNEIVDRIDDHLREKHTLSSSDLRTNIEFLFSELDERNWPRDCIEEVVKKFWTRDKESAEVRVTDFIERVRDLNRETTVYIPLSDFPNELLGIRFGGVLIEERNDDHIEFDERFEPVGDMEQTDAEDIEVFAKTTVTGDINQLVRLRATEKLENVFDILNFGEEYSIESPASEGIMRFYSEDEHERIRLIQRKSNIRYLDRGSPEQVLEKLEDFEELFDKERNTEIEKAMKNAMRWHRYAVESSHPSDKFLKFVVALESVLVPKESEGEARNMKERSVNLLGVLGPYRSEYIQFFDDVYSVRSEIAHGAEYRLSQVDLDLQKLRNYSARILSTVYGYLDSCDNIKEVLNELKSDNRNLREDRISDAPVDLGDSFSVDADLKQYDPDEEETYVIGEVQLEGVLKDDGQFVYYNADLVEVEMRTEESIIMNTVFDLTFEYDGKMYKSKDIKFVDGLVSDVLSASEDNPVSIRFFDVEEV